MLGLGEKEHELFQTMDDLREIDCQVLTLGQYLRPSPQHLPVIEFVTPERFRELKDAGEFLEHAQVHGNWYATSATWLKRQIEAGQDVLLEIDWQGAAQVRKLVPASVQIFILPPSLASLEERLVRRGQDDEQTITRRISAAREEIRHCGEFDYVIINQEFASALDDLSAIVRTSRLRSAQQRVRYRELLKQLL